MKNPSGTSLLTQTASWVRHHRLASLVGSVIALAGVGFVISCAPLSRTIVAPPQIPGATFAGSASCAQCHADIFRGFKTATHARLKAEGPHAANVGCESCHGPASKHNESGGAHDTIVNPGRSPEVCF